MRTLISSGIAFVLAAVIVTNTNAVTDPCVPEPTPTPTPTPTQSIVLLQDGFDNGLGQWAVTDEGDAVVETVNSQLHIKVTSSSTSRGNVAKALPNASAVTLSGDFKIVAEGGSGSNVPTFRLFKSGSRILDVYRQNVSGDAWLRLNNGSGGWTFTKIKNWIALNTTYNFNIHVVNGFLTIKIDNVTVYSAQAPLTSNTFDLAMIGAEHVKQVGDSYIDNVTIDLR